MLRLVAVVFVFVLLGAEAQAECLSRPDLSQKNGYWRYRIDRQTHRHCWYLSAGRGGRVRASRESERRETPKETARESRESARPREAARIPEPQPSPQRQVPVALANAQPSTAGLDGSSMDQRSVTAAYLVDDAWNVIGLEQAPAATDSLVARLKQRAKPAAVALAAAAPVVPVQEASLLPLQGTAVESAEPTVGSQRVFAVVLVWLLSTAALMWWLRPRQQPIALPFSLQALRRTASMPLEEDPPVVTQLRRLTEVVASQAAPASERGPERRRAISRGRGV
jgi:hypothetical protein